MQTPKVSIRVDLDPASTGRTVIVESITAADVNPEKPGLAQTCATPTDRTGQGRAYHSP